MANANFSVNDVSVDFDATKTSYADKLATLVEEVTATIIVATPTDWGALFSLRTPRAYVSVRAIMGGPPAIDIGGGAGPGTLTIPTLDGHQAALVELQAEGPASTDGERVARATWVIVDGT